MALNENIKKFRKEAGLTQKALASKSGLSFSMISKLECGDQLNPSFETIKKIADVLKVNPAKLISTPLSIEDQIDEYIAYKRGLNRSFSTSADHYNEDAEPCSDLNFRKKLQAINNMPIPSAHDQDNDSECMDMRPEIKQLFSALKDATRDEINQVTRLIETFKKR